MSDADFAALLCSRLCHDLVSPVGAITNGIEILQEEQDASMQEQVMDLLIKSSQQTSIKLQFFRLAFGAAGGFSAQLDLQEAKNSLTAFLEGTRIEIDWQSELSAASKSLVKLLLNCSLLGAEMLIRGGVLTVRLKETSNGYDLTIEAEGERLIMQDSVVKALTGQVSLQDVEPRSAPAYLAYSVAAPMGGAPTITKVTDTKAIITCHISNME